MITLNAVTKLYNEGRPNEFAALQEINLTLARGAMSVLRGPSGSGKTTLLSILACMARPTSGRVSIDGELVSGLPERFLTELRRTTFGFVFQRFNLVRGLTALENVMLPTVPLGADYAQTRYKAMARLEALGLADKAAMPIEHLSGGEAQRTAIARALINDPPILIADEPTANLDTALAEKFLAILAEERAAGRTVILTSHDPRIWEAEGVDRIVTLRDGSIVEGELAEGVLGEDGA
ncbi:ABC transporter ATP-binding protein [Thioclava sp. 15-R06ZXC-3]|uniref:ABC transporter ATP-binding protein n=1 Tax=Thioclava arctica TaxID=3238301 RepID=A0ABV3TNK3_9RHOB